MKILATETLVLAALAQKFAAPEYAFIHHARNGTGYERRTLRTADALALNLWPSRGLELHGFEIKTSRKDWLTEKDNPSKAEDIARFCDRWWLVVGDPAIVQRGDLPSTWGLLVPKSDGSLVVAVEAPKLDVLALDRLMLASILRRLSANMVPRDALKELAKADADARFAEHKRKFDGASERDRLAERVRELETRIDQFEKRSGVRIDAWGDLDIGAAVAAVVQATHAKQIASDILDEAQEKLAGYIEGIRYVRSHYGIETRERGGK